MTPSPDNPFTRMQKAFYDAEAARWSPEDRDPVVGKFDAHNAWADYDLLFDGLDTEGKVALDFGCGPGRNIVRYGKRFWRIDGADLSHRNLMNAIAWAAKNAAPLPDTYLCNGVDLADVPGERYDVVFSTICLQHIPVHAIRLGLFREFLRVLKPGGWFTAQMGFGDDGDPRGVGYYEDRWDAAKTNGGCDVKVVNKEDLLVDLKDAGFVAGSFRATVRPPGPNDWHPNWIFFRARKPEDK